MINLENHLKQLRFIYTNLGIAFRVKVANDRINNPNCGPNKLIIEVSATEGLARAILMNILIKKGTAPKKAYNTVRNLEIKPLFRELYKDRKTKYNKLLRSSAWKDFIWALKYRNFLIHECAFVAGDVSLRLIKAISIIRKEIKNEWL